VGDQLSLDQFAELEHVSMNFGRARTADLPTSYVAKIGLRQKVGIWAPVFSLLPDLVVGTHRIATIPTRLAQIKSAYLPIRILRPPVDFPKIVEVMQWHSVQNQDPGIAWFRNLLKSSIQSAGCLQQH
jgi:DNA-binding transcriptional LysR family regulator